MTFVHNIFISPRGHSRHSLSGYKPILSYNTWCSRVSKYHYYRIFLSIIFFFFFFFFFFYYQENRVWQSCNGDNLHEMQILFSWRNEKNVSECRQLKILPRVLGVMVCTNKSRIDLYMAKPTIRLVWRDGSAHTLWACTSVVWFEPSLIICTSYNLWG